MRLIDADALKEIISGNSYILRDSINSMNFGMFWDGIEQAIDESPTIDAVPIETICEMFGNEAPCNYVLFGVSVDDFMMSKCGKWCEDNCDKVPYTECWQKFFEAIEKWRKQNDCLYQERECL